MILNSVRQCPLCGAENPIIASRSSVPAVSVSAQRPHRQRAPRRRGRSRPDADLGSRRFSVSCGRESGTCTPGRFAPQSCYCLVPPLELAIYLLAVLVPVPVANVVIPAALWLAVHVLFAYGAYGVARVASPYSPDGPVPFFSRWYGCLTGLH
jgi:hypothetical protein